MTLDFLHRLLRRRTHRPDATTPQEEEQETRVDAFRIVPQLLRDMGCNITKEEDNDDLRAYHFLFQGGNFSIEVRDGQTLAAVVFPCFMEVEVEQLDYVRQVANDVNCHHRSVKVIYTIAGDGKKVAMHLLSHYFISANTEGQYKPLAKFLATFYTVAQHTTALYEDLVKKVNEDLEKKVADEQQETFAAYQLEIERQAKGGLWRANDTAHVTLGSVLHHLDFPRGITPHSLIIYTEDIQTLTDTPSIEGLDLCTLLVDTTATDGLAFGRKSVLMRLTNRGEDGDVCDTGLTIIVRAEEQTADALYMRATFVFDHGAYALTNSANQRDNTLTTFVFAYDKADTRQKVAEFRYYWQEAKDKAAKGLHSELSDIESYILGCTDADLGYNLYWGRRLYLRERYYEAAAHLENAYYRVSELMKTQAANEDVKEKYFSLSYYIGCCYMKLGLLTQAYFYLDTTFALNNIYYTRAYINLLMSADTYRATIVVENIVQQLAVQDGTYGTHRDEEPNAPLEDFIEFLQRAYATLLITNRRMAEADQFCNDLIRHGSPAMVEFAKSQLAQLNPKSL